MEHLLKARKLGSVSVRKQRAAERQKQKEFLVEQREERRKRFLRYSEIYNTDSDTSRSNSPENDSSVETPSEYSVRTPEKSLSPDVEIKIHATELALEIGANRRESIETTVKSTIPEEGRSKPMVNSLKPVVMSASLNRPCDFRYDRFSAIIDAIEIEPSDEETSSGDENDDDDGEEDYSPIEVATPVAIRMPITRPSVISVLDQRPQRFSVKNINMIMVNPPERVPPKRTNDEPIAEQKPHNGSGFLACEARPVEVLAPSSASMISFEPSSDDGRAISYLAPSDSALKKKSSMPILTRFTHSRMNSIKNFMKPQSISGPLPAVPRVPMPHQNRPSGSGSSILLSASSHKSKDSHSDKNLPSSPRIFLTEPPAQLRTVVQDVRPQTSGSLSQDRLVTLQRGSMNIQPPPIPAAEQVPPAMMRQKSFSNLRRRSGSLGQALKFSSSRSKPPLADAHLPPMPAIRVPTRDSLRSVDLPIPSPKTAKSSRKSGMSMYSAFPSSGQKPRPYDWV